MATTTGANDETTIKAIRAAAAGALGDRRLDRVAADASLVRGGIISSLEIVVLATALEERFALQIPAVQVTMRNFDSLRGMAQLVATGGGRAVPPADAATPTDTPLLRASAVAAMRRPFLLVALTLCFLALLDAALGAVMRGPLAERYRGFLEHGHRLYPVGGSYSQDDLAFSIVLHRIVEQPARGAPRVAVFGDSGTIGSFVTPAEAIPGALEAALRPLHPEAQVFNLAFFMQFFAKDLMILQAVLERSGGEIPFDVAVFTLGDDYFRSEFISRLPVQMPYLALNGDLLERFAARLPEAARPALVSMASELRATSKSSGTAVERWLARHSSLFHYAPYFRYLVTEVLRSERPFDYAYGLGRRPFVEPVPERPPTNVQLSLGLAEKSIDRRVVSMARATIQFMRERGVKVLLYLKPHGPHEWRHLYRQGANASAAEIAQELCAQGRCSVVDLRWSLSGSQFTDTLAHYNAAANRLIAERLAETVMQEIAR